MAMSPNARVKKPGTPRLPIPKQITRHNAQSHTQPTAPKPTVTAPPVNSAAPPLTVTPPLFDLRKVRIISVKEAAFRSMKSEDTIYKWLRTGRLKGWQPGGSGCNVLISEQSLEEVLESSMQFGR